MYFPTIPQRWPIKFGTNLTQAEVSSFKSARFVLEDGIAKVEAEFWSDNELPSTEVLAGIGTNPREVPRSFFQSIPPSAFKFSPGLFGNCEGLFPIEVQQSDDGDKRPSIRNGKVF